MKKLTLFLVVLFSSLITTQAQTCPAVSFVFEPNTTVAPGKLQPYALATDDYGNTFIAGDFLGNSVSFNNGVPTLQKVNGEFFIAKYDKFGNTLWAVNFGNTNTNPYLTGIAVSPDGSQIYVTGNYQGTAVFGSQSLTSAFGTNGSSSSYDVFVAKLIDNGGTRTWAWALGGGGKGQDYSRGIAIDNFGKIYIGGHLDATTATNQNIVFGSLPVISCLYGDDSFVARVSDNSTTATWDWLQKASANVACGTIITYDDDLFGITCNKATGDVFVTGYYYQEGNISAHTFSFGGLSIPNTNSNDNEAYTLKLNTNGVGQWITKAGGTTIGNQEGRGIAVDSVGNVFVIGESSNTCNFGLNTNEIPSIASAGSTDVFIGKINANGTWAWAKGMGGNNIDLAGGIDYQNGQVWGVGSFRATASFKTTNQVTALGTTISPANYPDDLFLVNLDKNGNWLNDGVTQMGGNDYDRLFLSNGGNNMAFDVDKNNVPHAAGRYAGTAAVFGSTTLTRTGENPFVFRANCGETPAICTQNLTARYAVNTTFTAEYTNFKINTILKDAAGNTYMAGKLLADCGFTYVNGSIYSAEVVKGKAIIVKYNSNNQVIYVLQGGGDNAEITDIAFLNNRVIVTGNYSGSASFESNVHVNFNGLLPTVITQTSNNNSQDIFVAEVEEFNIFYTAYFWRWVSFGGGAGFDHAAAICTTTDRIFITGYLGSSGTAITFGSQSIASLNALRTMFVAKINPTVSSLVLGLNTYTYYNGIWDALARPTQTPNPNVVAQSFGTDIAFDIINDDITVTGSYMHEDAANPSQGLTFLFNTLTPTKGFEGLLAIFDLTLANSLGIGFGKFASFGYKCHPTAISFDPQGFSYVVGNYSSAIGSPLVFQESPLTSVKLDEGVDDIFLAKLNDNYEWLWAKKIGGAGNERAAGVAYRNGQVYVAGSFEQTINIQGTSLVSSGGSDIFLSRFSELGQNLPKYTQKGGGLGADAMPLWIGVYSKASLLVDNATGNATIHANINNSAAFGSTTLTAFGGNSVIINELCSTCSTSDITLINPNHNVSAGLAEHKTSQKVLATNYLLGGNTLMRAGKSIELNAGFKAENGVIFKAEIGGCN